jgi:dTDP-4-amino-4,6-dideoxygalactose transaminase
MAKTTIPYGRQNVSAADRAAVDRVLRSPWLTQGPDIVEFETALTRKTRAKFAVAVSNGTTALHLAYIGVGLAPGDEIIVPANTFVATANAALYIGAKPVFADIELTHYNLDPKELPRRLTRRTRAIAVVHFGGHPADMKPILAFARKHRLLVIEDGAQAIGARYHGTPIGGLATAATTFSFHPVKPITTAEGGAIVTNSKTVAKRMKLLRSHGVTKNAKGWNVMTELGFNYRITDIQAALGTSQLKQLPRFEAARRRVVRWYKRHLAGITQIILPSEARGVRSSWHLYVIRTVAARHRDPLYRALHRNNILANFHYPPVYSNPYYRTHGYRNIHLPNADHYVRTCITLPLHTLMTEADVRRIAGTIRSYFGG